MEERSRRFEEKTKYHVDMDPNFSLFLIFLWRFLGEKVKENIDVSFMLHVPKFHYFLFYLSVFYLSEGLPFES